MTRRVHHHTNLIYSPGTQVVSLVEVSSDAGRTLHPWGAVGVVVKSPSDLQHSYRVRFPDGVEESLKPDQLVMLAKFKEGEIGEPVSRRDNLFDRVIFRCIIGSRAYGLDDDQSDIDYRGIFLPPADLHWSLYGVPEQLECHETQEAYWEIQKFLVLALKANPNVLECLYSPLVEKATPLAEELLGMRSLFLSRLVYQTYNGYVMSQFKKIQASLRKEGFELVEGRLIRRKSDQNEPPVAVKWKHVMHLIRLLISGIHVLREGHVTVRVDEHRDRLLSIKRGEMPWEETEQWRTSLHAEFDRALGESKLPERPDYERANDFLVKARRAALAEELP